MEFPSPPAVQSAQDPQALYRRCCSDDLGACNAAFQELGCLLTRIAFARLGARPHLAYLAEDCAQQALAIIWRKLHTGNGPDHPEWFTTWSAGIVIHRVLDELRRLARTATVSLDELAGDGEWQLPAQTAAAAAGSRASIADSLASIAAGDRLASIAADPAAAVLADDFSFATAADRQRFVALVADHPRLTADAKLVLLHGYLLEQDDHELAAQLGKSRATVRVLRFRGLKLLRSDLEFMAQVQSLTHAGVDTPSLDMRFPV
jgi:RNA polymerase sigma factor (sigma-70 family)